MRSLIKIALLIVVGVLVYNYFLGSEEEKATSEKVFRQVKDVGKSIGELIKNERQKFKDGKYDEAFDKLGEAYEKLKGKVNEGDQEDQEMLKKLEKQKEDLEMEKKQIEDELKKENPDEEVIRRSPSFEEELRQLMDETGNLLDRVMKKEKKD